MGTIVARKNTWWRRIAGCASIVWEMNWVMIQMVRGAWHIAKLKPPIITVFGGARFDKEDYYFKLASQLGNMLVQADISVLTGGGPGIMEGASCGAFRKTKAQSIGIGVKDLGEQMNPCVDKFITLNHFFARKWLLTRYASGFIVFPGGFGTLDELTEVLTLMQTNKLDRVPIVLVGTEYWGSFMDWLSHEAIEHKVLTTKDLELFTITDDLQQAVCLMQEACVLLPPKEQS